MERSSCRVALALCCAVFCLVGCAEQDEYPNRPITLICPWGAGGGTDAVSRQIAAHLEAELGAPVTVVNATGGKGVTGHNRGFRARPDGYTITMATLELNMLHWNGLTDLTYHDCIPLMSVNEDYAAVFVQSDAPWKTISDLEAAIRAEPKTLTASGTASGGAWHLALAGWLIAAGLNADDVVWVSSTGAGPSLKELMSGGVDLVCCSLPEAATQMKNGDVRALGVMSSQPIPGFEDVPTFVDAGFDWTLGGWRGLVVPRETPPDVVATLASALEKITSGKTTILVGASQVDGEVVRREQTFPQFMEEQGYDATRRGPDEFKRLLAERDEQLGALLTSDVMQSVNEDRFDAAAFPNALLAGVVVVLALMVVQRRFRPAEPRRESSIDSMDETSRNVSRRGIVACLLFVLAIVGYTIWAEAVGFVILSAFLVGLMLWSLGNRLTTCVAVTLIVVPIAYQFFAGFLRVPLPRGWWGW